MGANTVVTALLLRPMGLLSDRVRRDRLVVAGGRAAALLTLCLPLAETFPQLLGLSVCIGAAGALSMPASSALLVEEGGRQGMGLTMGVFNGAMNLGAVLAPLAGGVAFGFFGHGMAVLRGRHRWDSRGPASISLRLPFPRFPAEHFPGVSTPIAGASPLSVDRVRQEG